MWFCVMTFDFDVLMENGEFWCSKKMFIFYCGEYKNLFNFNFISVG